MYNEVINALGNDKPFEARVKHRLLKSALDILTNNLVHKQLQLERSNQIRPLMSDLWMNQDYQETVQEFIVQLTDRECQKRDYSYVLKTFTSSVPICIAGT